MTQYIIYDLDGCIADDRARLPLIDHSQPDPWAKYHEGCDRDPLINKSWAALGRLLCTPIIFTSRPEVVRAKTQRWLQNVAGLNAERLFMRPDDDHTPSIQLKERFLRRLEQTDSLAFSDIVLAFDDRREILDMYEGYGIKTIQTYYPKGALI